MTQTPINSFLVTQTPEERKIILEKKTKKLFTDMSSSSASPKLKRAAGRAIKIRKTQEVTRKLPMSAGKVSLLSKYFETEEQSTSMMKKQPGSNNNSRLYGLYGPEARNTAVSSTSHSPEMSLQSENSKQPMRRLHLGQVTPELLRQPMRGDIARQHGTE